MIHMIVARLHVGADYLAAVRYVVSRLKGKRRAFLRLSREDRHWIVRETMRAHAANRALYVQVMG